MNKYVSIAMAILLLSILFLYTNTSIFNQNKNTCRKTCKDPLHPDVNICCNKATQLCIDGICCSNVCIVNGKPTCCDKNFCIEGVCCDNNCLDENGNC
ncbi:MAG: hypothetical protein ACW98X_19125, partial [Promethearchaeota archaeon]